VTTLGFIWRCFRAGLPIQSKPGVRSAIFSEVADIDFLHRDMLINGLAGAAAADCPSTMKTGSMRIEP